MDAHHREISAELFRRVKPVCVELNSLRDSQSARIPVLLASITGIIDAHAAEYADSLYILSPKLADYVFFPLSNLLQKPVLDEATTRNILCLVKRLLRYAWRDQLELIDQIYPLILYLSAGKDAALREETVSNKSTLFKDAIVSIFSELVRILPPNYYTLQRLPLLGDTITVVLATIVSCEAKSDDQIHMVEKALNTLSHLSISHLSHDKLAQVLPGIVSKLTKFSSRNLHYTIFIKITDLFKHLVVSVFNDEELGTKLGEHELNSLDDVLKLAEMPADTIDFSHSNGVFRTKEWLEKSSQAMLVSIAAFLKSVLRHTYTLKTKQALTEALVDLIVEIFNNCYASLYGFIPMALEALGTICAAQPEENDFIGKTAQKMCLFQHPKTLYSRVRDFFLEITEKHLSILGFSSDEEKVGSYLSCVKLTFCILYKSTRYSTQELTNLKKTLYTKLQHRLSVEVHSEKTKTSKVKTLNNSDIELPPSIDAKKIGRFNKDQGPRAVSSDLVILTHHFDPSILKKDHAGYFQEFTSEIEAKVVSTVDYIASLAENIEVDLMEDILDEDSVMGLWLANRYLGSHENASVVGEFLQVDDLLHDDASYLLLSKMQVFYETASPRVGFGRKSRRIDDLTLAVCFDTVQTLAGSLSKEDFHTDVLIEYLYPLLEALSYENSLAHQSACKALDVVVSKYYDGSLEKLVLENSDYLVDSLRINLSVASNLTPSLSALLLVVVKTAGIQLLEQNKLMDVLQEIFVTIDSYHGYSVIVEGFFVVFQELVEQISKRYLKPKPALELLEVNTSPYRPWGMQNVHQLLKLVSDSQKIIDPFEFDNEKEYFKQDQIDSDDEDDQEKEGPTETPEEWPSPIPEATYFLVQRIFIYSFALLNHDSNSLKNKVLRSMVSVYPLLCTNYKLVLPIVTSNWGALMALMCGTVALGPTDEYSPARENLIRPTLSLMTMIIEKDTERFFGRKFVESADFLLEKMVPKRSVGTSTSLIVSNSTLHKMYSLYLATGLRVYERTVKTTKKFQLLGLCHKLGMPDVQLSLDMRNMMYVIAGKQHERMMNTTSLY